MGNSIMQGSTPTHTFNIQYPKDMIERAIVTYNQGDATVFEKKDDDIDVRDYKFIVKLSQEDTLSLDANKDVCIQIKVKTVDGDVIPSRKIYKDVEEVLNKEVI